MGVREGGLTTAQTHMTKASNELQSDISVATRPQATIVEGTRRSKILARQQRAIWREVRTPPRRTDELHGNVAMGDSKSERDIMTPLSNSVRTKALLRNNMISWRDRKIRDCNNDDSSSQRK